MANCTEIATNWEITYHLYLADDRKHIYRRDPTNWDDVISFPKYDKHEANLITMHRNSANNPAAFA